MKILGIDASLTNFATCIYEGDDKICINDIFKSKKKDVNRLNDISLFLKGILLPNDFDGIVLEGYSYGSRNSMVFDIGELGGIIKIIIRDYIIDVRKFRAKRCTLLIVPPQTLKKYICGAGNAKKNIMIQQIYKKYNKEFKDDNSADAFALAKLGEVYYYFNEGSISFKKDTELFNKLKEQRF